MPSMKPTEKARAAERLTDAVKRLEAAVYRRREVDDDHREWADVVQRMSNDRADLARRLDQCQARAGRLEAANRDVSARLVQVMEQVRTLVDGPERGE